MDLVTIIIPTFNRAHLINETLDSLINQTYLNWECIVVDDHSTDDTEEVLKKYTTKESRISFCKRPNEFPKGANSCRNYGFELAKGDFIKWFDSDDIMNPLFLEIQVKVLIENKDFDFCACRWVEFNLDGEIKEIYPTLTTENPIKDFFLDSHVFATPAPLWRKSFLNGKNLFNLKLFRSQEADFHFRMLMFKPKYVYLENFLFKVRRGHDSIHTNSNKLISKLSIQDYFHNAFEVLTPKKAEYKEVLEYIFFRQLVNFSEVLTKSKNPKYLLKSFQRLFFYFKFIKVSAKIKFRILVGIISTYLFSKGYKLLYVKEFQHKKNIS